MNGKRSNFKEGVIRVVNMIPYGKVVSYGQVALYVGVPRAARQVGWTLNRLEEKVKIPWWRVVNNSGRISIKGSKYSAEDQKKLLEKEGIEISDDLTFDIERYRFLPGEETIKKLELSREYIEMVSQKTPFSKYFSK